GGAGEGRWLRRRPGPGGAVSTPRANSGTSHTVGAAPLPAHPPPPPLWLGAGSPEAIRRAGREGYNMLLDQIAPIELTIERVAVYRAEREAQGLLFDGMQGGVTRALPICRNDEERRQAFALRRKTLGAIGALARGPGAERYRSPASFADADIAAENAALIGTPDQIATQLRQLRAGGVGYVLLIDTTGSKQTLRGFVEEVIPRLRESAPAEAREVVRGERGL